VRLAELVLPLPSDWNGFDFDFFLGADLSLAGDGGVEPLKSAEVAVLDGEVLGA